MSNICLHHSEEEGRGGGGNATHKRRREKAAVPTSHKKTFFYVQDNRHEHDCKVCAQFACTESDDTLFIKTNELKERLNTKTDQD